MNRSKQPFAGLACLLAGAYLVLAVISVACAAEHPEPGTFGHHHGSTLSHSNFCAWACQANPTSEAGPSALVLQPFLLVAVSLEGNPSAVTGGGLFSTSSRGPPHQS